MKDQSKLSDKMVAFLDSVLDFELSCATCEKGQRFAGKHCEGEANLVMDAIDRLDGEDMMLLEILSAGIERIING